MNYKNYKTMNQSRLKIELFPFLSILLCILGVLGFMQLILSALSSRTVELKADVTAKGYKEAFQVICYPEGIVVKPPIKSLKILAEKSNNSTQIKEIRSKRIRILNDLKESQISVRENADEPKELEIIAWLNELITVNNEARQSGIDYEEFLLFGIYPSGSRHYHTFKDLISSSDNLSKYESISIGLEPIESGLNFALPGVKELLP